MGLTTYLNPDVIQDGGISASKIAAMGKSITWSELKTLRDGSKLIPGMQYRITDYQCTTTQEGTRAVNHQFDIIVTADDENTLNEVARAIQHDGDTYFANCDLNAWKIWYCLDNDTARFAWADGTNGKGIIYRMIDEFNNDVPYDFKNIQFYRKWDSNKSLWSTTSSNNTGVPCYTFSSSGNESTASFTDFSLSISNHVYSNVIKGYVKNKKQALNNICFFGDNCSNNSFSSGCYRNSFGSYCGGNSFGSNCGGNNFGTSCTNNSFGDNCNTNSFGSNCGGNNFGISCTGSRFGSNCNYIIFASDRSSSTKYEYYRNNQFGDGCNYIVFTGAGKASSYDQVQNYNFAQGLQGTYSAYLIVDGVRGRVFETKVALNSNGELKIYCEADLIQ